MESNIQVLSTLNTLKYDKTLVICPHKHENYLELSYLAGKNIYHYLNGSNDTISSSAIILVFPGELHSLKSFDQLTERIVIKFACKDVSTLNSLAESLNLKNIQFDNSTKGIVYTPINNQFLYKELFNKMLNIEHDENYDTVSSLLLKTIMVNLLFDFYNNHNIPKPSKKDLAFQLHNYLNSNFTCDLTLNDLEERFLYNKFYLNRIHKAVYGNTIKDFLLSLRLGKAQNLLIDTDYSIKDIAGKVGYSDCAQFSNIFKKKIGESPEKYRKKILIEKVQSND